MPTASGHDELVRAVHAVCATLVELRADPASESIRHRIDTAGLILESLGRDLTTIVLGRLLDSVEACYRAGQSDSGSLADRERSAVRALRLDPRWNPSIGAMRDAS